MKVAVPWPKHSPRFGHEASSHTVCSLASRRIPFRRATFGRLGAFARIHDGSRIRSCGTILIGMRAVFAAPLCWRGSAIICSNEMKPDFSLMRTLSLILLTISATAAGASTDTSVDAETGLATWQTETAGIQVRLTQISSDQARAFYLARGFSAAAAERYAAECVFMTVVPNIGDKTIRHRLADWRDTPAGQPPRAIRSKAEWERLWHKYGIDEPARIAFNWAQFPVTQTFAPGDWNQGMTAYSVPRGGRVDLRFVWRTLKDMNTGGQAHSGTIEQARCTDDHPYVHDSPGMR